MKKIIIIATAVATLALTGCSSDASTARHNLDTAAEQFEVNRKIVFINGITDEYLLEVEGLCSYEAEDSQVVVICKTGPSEYWKHSMTRSDNVTVVVAQTESSDVDVYRHRVIFKPEGAIPNIDVETTIEDAIKGDRG